MSLLAKLVNHIAPSGPAVIPGPAPGAMYSWIAPDGVMRPTLLPPSSANHMAPSGPSASRTVRLAAVGIGYSVILPSTAIRPIWLALGSANHSAPSAPAASPAGVAFGVGSTNSLI